MFSMGEKKTKDAFVIKNFKSKIADRHFKYGRTTNAVKR